jgi:4-coumarate--CoA ligase
MWQAPPRFEEGIKLTFCRHPDIEVPDKDIWAFQFERNDKPFPDDKGMDGATQNASWLLLTLCYTVVFVDSETKRSYTWIEVKQAASTFGGGLKGAWGWKKGDVLGMYAANSIDTPVIVWGTHWAGGIISPANPAYTPEELAFQLKDSGAKGLVTQMPFLANALAAAKLVGLPENRIIIIGDERDPSMKFKHFTSIRNISGASRYRRTKVNPKEDLAFLVYSSGTTGHPKGVMLSHENIVANILMLEAGEADNLKWNGGVDNKGDRILAFLPFFHIYGRSCNSATDGIVLILS